LLFSFVRETVEAIKDDHLWVSVFKLPSFSVFTRTDRLTCCFVILFMYLLMNILYYDQNSGIVWYTPDGFRETVYKHIFYVHENSKKNVFYKRIIYKL
jgi:hypothetical protein